MNPRPKVAVLTTQPVFDQLFTEETRGRLFDLAEVTQNSGEKEYTPEETAEALRGVDGCITTWHPSYAFTPEVMRYADQLKIIAHVAGTVKPFLPVEIFDRGIAVTHSAWAIAPAVAENTIALMLMSLRFQHLFNQALKDNREWASIKPAVSDRAPRLTRWREEELGGKTVGLVGAGYVGSLVIGLLKAFGATVLVYDPFMPDSRAADLGVAKVSLDDLLKTSDIVSMHAPSTPETKKMIGAREVALMRDGAVFVNTGRSWTVDQAALVEELRSQRIRAALDVFDVEPLPVDSPIRELGDNVIIGPHISAGTQQMRHRCGQGVVEELGRFFRGEELKYRVTKEMLQWMS